MSERTHGSRRSFLSSFLSLIAGAVAGCTALAEEKKKPEPVDKYGGPTPAKKPVPKPARKYGGPKPATKYGGRKKDTKD